MHKGKSLFIIHPFLFALFPIISLYAFNVGSVPLEQLFAPLVFVFLSAIILFVLLRLVFKNTMKMAFFYSVFILLFFSYGYIGDLIGGYNSDMGNSDLYIFLIMAIIILLLIYFLHKRSRYLFGINKFMNLVSIFLIVLPTINIASYYLKQHNTSMKAVAHENQVAPPVKSGNNTTYPNIYYIIPDAYGRQDILKDFYGFDNAEFIDALRERGFFVAQKARSNYAETHDSIASALNFEYVFDTSKSYDNLINLEHNSKVSSFLKERGYDIIYVYATQGNIVASIDLGILSSFHKMNEFDNVLLYSTPLPTVLTRLHLYDPFNLYRKRISQTFDDLSQSPGWKSPFFIYVHFGAPHPPFVFGKNGEPIAAIKDFTINDGYRLIRNGRLTLDEYLKYYSDQVSYLNKRVLETIDAILVNSSQPPIIIIQGDHGPRSSLKSWQSAGETNVKENLSILSAFYLPDNGKEQLYEGITPVNSFRIIFDRYFNGTYGLLEDRSYFREHGKDHDTFVDVTEKVVK